MSLFQQVNEQIKEAMKAKNEARLRALRSIKSAFLILATETGAGEPNDEACLKAIQKLAKQRKDSIAVFEQQNRNDLASKEQEELSVLEEYLPKPLSEEELTNILTSLIQQSGASGMKDLGKVMPLAVKEVAGRADGAVVATILKNLLNN